MSPRISSLFTSSNTSENIRTTAWLTDTGMWSSYKNSDAVFAIGSPTVELFAASYNNRYNRLNYITLGLVYYGYEENTSQGWLQTKDNYGIYNKSKSPEWWIASPYSDWSFRSDDQEIIVNGEYGGLSKSLCVNSNPVRPIVCIQTSVFDSKYTMSPN